MAKLLRAAGLALSLSACAGVASAQKAGAPAPQDDAEKARLSNLLIQEPHRHPEGLKTTYEVGKEYLRKYGETEDEIVRYVRHWVVRYELAVRKFYQHLLPRPPAGPRPVCRRRDP